MTKTLLTLTTLTMLGQATAQTTYDPRREPQADYRAALREAQRRNVNVILDLGGDWCGDCRRLDAFIAANPDVARTLKDNYVFLRVYVGDERDNSAFLSRFPSFNWVPYFFVISPDGRVIKAMDTRNLMVNRQFSKPNVSAFLKTFTRP